MYCYNPQSYDTPILMEEDGTGRLTPPHHAASGSVHTVRRAGASSGRRVLRHKLLFATAYQARALCYTYAFDLATAYQAGQGPGKGPFLYLCL